MTIPKGFISKHKFFDRMGRTTGGIGWEGWKQLEFNFMKDYESKNDFARGYNSFSGINIKATFGKPTNSLAGAGDIIMGIYYKNKAKGIMQEKQLRIPGV